MTHLGLLGRHADVALVDAQVLGALGARVVEGVAGVEVGLRARCALLGRRVVHAVELDLVPLLRSGKLYQHM